METNDTNKPKTYQVEGFGEVGEANLEFGVRAILSGKDWHDLAVGESCVVETRDGSERITRTR